MTRVISAVVAGLTLVVAACSTSGRELRTPNSDQTLSIVTTTSAPATSVPVATFPSTLPGEGESVGNAGMTVGAPWNDNEVIDVRYTCQGANVAPAITWAGVPAEAAELAIAMIDLDADDNVQWVIAGIDPASTGIAEGKVPAGAVQATNGSGTVGWSGPCPTDGQHTYLLTLYALGQPSALSEGANGAEAITSLEQIQLASVAQSGLFSS